MGARVGANVGGLGVGTRDGVEVVGCGVGGEEGATGEDDDDGATALMERTTL